MSVKKQVLKSKPICKVTFAVSKKEAGKAETIHLVGDFNDWNETSMALTKLKSGAFKLIVDLSAGKEYQFRYLINGTTWMNDPAADNYAASGISDEQNSVIVL